MSKETSKNTLNPSDFLEYSSSEDPSGPPTLIGKNPLKMGGEALVKAGLTPTTNSQAIRLHCIDCSGGSLGEVRKCVSFRCSKWPQRMGKNPFHGMGGKNGNH